MSSVYICIYIYDTYIHCHEISVSSQEDGIHLKEKPLKCAKIKPKNKKKLHAEKKRQQS